MPGPKEPSEFDLTSAVAIDPAVLVGDPPEVAPRLLNKILVRGPVAARIVEVEAYWGERDPASHAYRGQTPRNATMFSRRGLLYVYRSYGIHWCANIVLGDPGEAAAVLLRAVEPLVGWELVRARRSAVKRTYDLTNGPGKLCAALEITNADDGLDLLDPDSSLRLMSDGTRPPEGPLITSRIGISKAVGLPWRFAVPSNGWVSKGRPANVGP